MPQPNHHFSAQNLALRGGPKVSQPLFLCLALGGQATDACRLPAQENFPDDPVEEVFGDVFEFDP